MASDSSTRTEHDSPRSRTDLTAAGEAVLLFPRRNARRLSRTEASRAVRLLILCGTAAERAVVAMHAFHRLTLSDTANRLRMPGGAAADLFASVAGRLTTHERRRKAKRRLRKLTAAVARKGRPGPVKTR